MNKDVASRAATGTATALAELAVYTADLVIASACDPDVHTRAVASMATASIA